MLRGRQADFLGQGGEHRQAAPGWREINAKRPSRMVAPARTYREQLAQGFVAGQSFGAIGNFGAQEQQTSAFFHELPDCRGVLLAEGAAWKFAEDDGFELT